LVKVTETIQIIVLTLLHIIHLITEALLLPPPPPLCIFYLATSGT
jgi:hypothetical protein